MPYPFMRIASAEGRRHPDNISISGSDYEHDRRVILKKIEDRSCVMFEVGDKVRYVPPPAGGSGTKNTDPRYVAQENQCGLVDGIIGNRGYRYMVYFLNDPNYLFFMEAELVTVE